jgi:cytochrome c-type protein NapC
VGWFSNLAAQLRRLPVFALILACVVLTLGSVAVYDFAMASTSTDEFCISCHEIRENTWPQFQESLHFNNRSGVNATCADCHIPVAFIPKMVRKIQASREVWGHFVGVIDTPEKYAAHAPAMKAREVARLRANDSLECRNCHDRERMLMALQSAKAREYHGSAAEQGKTCIDCHRGIAHPENLGEEVEVK